MGSPWCSRLLGGRDEPLAPGQRRAVLVEGGVLLGEPGTERLVCRPRGPAVNCEIARRHGCAAKQLRTQISGGSPKERLPGAVASIFPLELRGQARGGLELPHDVVHDSATPGSWASFRAPTP